MSGADVEIVRDQFAAVNERDFERAMNHYADDVVLTVPPSFANPGVYEGREAVGEWFGDWFRNFRPDYRFEITEAVDLGGLILIVADHRGHGRASGAEVHGTNAYLYRLRDGKVVRVEFHLSREDAVASADVAGSSGEVE